MELAEGLSCKATGGVLAGSQRQSLGRSPPCCSVRWGSRARSQPVGRKEPRPQGKGVTEKVGEGEDGRDAPTDRSWDTWQRRLRSLGDVCTGRSWDELWKDKKDLPESEVVVIADAYSASILCTFVMYIISKTCDHRELPCCRGERKRRDLKGPVAGDLAGNLWR